ncbi:MAG TPA: outer membrane protein assembly factor BamD [Longimicrobiales bacterium]|nr:outer membrane protein assembly factor BamD [Longimicrobiales bacterium]
MSKPRLAGRSLAAALALVLAACSASDPYQGMDAEQLFRIAEIEMADEDWDDAIQALERLQISFGDWSRIADARLMLADAYFRNGDYLTARSEYQRFRDRFVAHPRAPEAGLGECRSLAQLTPDPERDQTYTQEAIVVCGNVSIDYAGTAEADSARAIRQELRETMAEKEFLNAEHYMRRELYDPAIIYYQFVLDNYGDTEFAPRALLGLYRANEAIGYDDLAEQARQRLLSEYPESEAAAELREEDANS